MKCTIYQEYLYEDKKALQSKYASFLLLQIKTASTYKYLTFCDTRLY